MREPLRDQGRLRHILGAIDNVLEFMEEKTADDLRRDRILFYAVVKNIEIIGEAAYMLSDDFKTSHPGTEWKSIVAMRHFLVHGYYQVSEEEIWEVVHKDLLPLKEQIRPYVTDYSL